MKSGKSIPLTIITNILLMGIAVITGSLVARLLGPEGRGELAAIQNWAAFIALIAAVGLPDAIVYFSGRYSEKSGSYLFSAIILAVLIAAPFIIIGFLLTPRFLSAQSSETVALAQRYLVIFLLLQATQGMLLHPLRGQSDFSAWNLLRVFYPLGWLIVIFGAYFFDISSVTYLITGYLIVLGVMAIPIFIIVVRRISSPLAIQPMTWKPLLKFGLPSVTSAIPQALNLRLDQMIMAAILAPALLGYYTVAVTWSSGLSPFLLGIAVVAFPTIASKKSRLDQVDSLASSTRIAAFMAILLIILLLLITPFGILLLFGDEFARSIPVAMVLVIASGISGFSMVLVEGLRGLGLPQKVIIGQISGLAFTIFALVLLLPALGIIGAAIASIIGYSVTTLILFYQIRRVTESSTSTLLYLRVDDIQLAGRNLRAFLGDFSELIRDKIHKI